MRIPLLAGRDITLDDRSDAPRVAVVNQAFAKKFGLGENPVGKRIAIDADSPQGELDIEIVGLAKDTHYSGVKAGEPPIVFRPYRQDPETGGIFFYVRSSLPTASIFRAARETVARLDPALPIVGLKTVTQQVRENVYLDRMIGTLSAAFAALATLLAAVGLYGVLAYTVAQRSREIGVRMALGAGSWNVRAMVLREVGRMAAIGAVVGVAAALALGRLAQSALFGRESYDPVVVAAAVGILAAVALGAGYLPARRASRVPPMRALRSE
jgi:predicted permease